MMQSSLAPAAERRPGRHSGRAYPWIFVAAFVGIVAVNATMVSFAISTFSGIETPKHYVEGLAYNQLIDAARAQAALGWTVTIRSEPVAAEDESRTVRLLVDARDADGAALDGLAVRALLVRPTRSGSDREVTLVRVAPGAYRAEAVLPLPGLWDLRVVLNRGDQHWQDVKRLSLP